MAINRVLTEKGNDIVSKDFNARIARDGLVCCQHMHASEGLVGEHIATGMVPAAARASVGAARRAHLSALHAAPSRTALMSFCRGSRTERQPTCRNVSDAPHNEECSVA